MKFNKDIKIYSEKYKKYVQNDWWFNYKHIKKLLKEFVIKYKELSFNNDEDDECCICMENKNLMKTFCCHNSIHHVCLVHTLAFTTNSSCPLCRSPMLNVIKYDVTNIREKRDADLLGLISNIHINIMNIENICKNKKIKNSKVLQKYKEINNQAIVKICKKIYKRLNIDLKQYFINFINRNGILVGI
jgi:hypothetical protein